MREQIRGSTLIKGSCVYCGAALVERWTERPGLGAQAPVRVTDPLPWCLKGHRQPALEADE